MDEVASNELGSDGQGVLRRVEAGEGVFITLDGRRVAVLRPFASRPTWLPRADFVLRFSSRQADAGLAAEIHHLAPDTTDGLG